MKFGLLVFFAANTLAAPFLSLDDNLPGAEVKGFGCSSSRFRQGHTFTYDYAGETINKVEGSSMLVTGLLLKARIYITSLSECKFHMQLDSAELSSKSSTQEIFSTNADSAKFKAEIEKNDLFFSMTGNKIITLQVDDSEPTHILNIKRGILSTLQVDESAKTEIDIHGSCQTTVQSENGILIKSKRLSECNDRARNEIGIQTGAITVESSLKPLDSNLKCQYTMNGDVIKSVVCDETHLFKPFSAGYESSSGAMTTVKQTLNLVKSNRNLKSKFVSIKGLGVETTLAFDHTNEELKSSTTVYNQAVDIMNRLVDQTKLSAKQDSAHEFSSLVFLLRKMDEKRIKAIFNRYFDCIKSEACTSKDVRDVSRQYLLDSIAYCGTTTCISMVHDVILSGDVTGERMNMFLQSVALVAKTTTDMIRDVLNIAKNKPSRQAFLTLGTMMARHCAENTCDFDENSPITQAETFLESLLGQDCENQEDHNRVEEILMALKAIGNAKRPDRAFRIILRCAKKAMHANITRAAFDAIRGFTCGAGRAKDLVNIVKERNMDPEKRIHAFIVMMKCPTEKSIEHVLRMLENEETKQVANFVWSMFTNIMESSDPKNNVAKELLKKMTKDRPLKNFDLPIHHYSRAYEKSFHFDSIDSGATAEANVIFHPDGYLPRSAMMNITARVMGVPVNLIEAMVGMDGLETVLENAFGPNGVMPDNVILNMFNITITSEKFKELAQKRENKRRSRRAAQDNISDLHNRVSKETPQPSGHLSFKIMGQEIRVMSYDDIFWMIDQIDNMNVIQLLLNIAKGGHKTFSKSAMFLEMTHNVPTGLGLPLRLKLVGSTVATVELDGKFDIRNMFWGPGSLTIDGYVKPTAVVELSGQMGVESHYASTGVFVNSSMFFSNIMKGKVIYREGQKLQINMDTPEEPIQLFNFSSTPFIYMNNEIALIDGVDRKINPDFCMKSQILGYGLCTNLRLPVAFRNYEAPYYPLTGPAHFGMKLVRGDLKLTTFQFLVTMTKKNAMTKGKIEFSTPGATYERKLGGEMTYSDIDNTKTLVLSTERYGKYVSVEFNYNTISHRTEIQTKNNILTTKDFITKFVYFNQTNMVSQQYGFILSAEYDWYKFEHVSKYVRKSTGHMLYSSTLYYPKKTVTGVLEYNTKERKMTAKFDSEQLNQAVEVSGKWEKSADEKGFTLTATHITSGKSASFYGGLVNTDNKKELITAFILMDKTAKNVLGYYNKNGVKSVENLITVNGKTAKFEAKLDNKNTVNTLIILADVVGKKGSMMFELTNKRVVKSLRMKVEAAEKSAEMTMGYYVIAEKKLLKIDADVMGRKGEVFAAYTNGKATVGGKFGKYIGGVEGVYTNNHEDGKSICSSFYYGTETSPKKPMKTCVTYHALVTSYMHNKLSFTSELTDKNMKGELAFDFQKHAGHITLKAEAKYNEKVYAKNFYNLKYKDIMNSELKMGVEVGKYSAGYKWFIKQSGSTTDLGMEAYVMDKSIMFINQYELVKLGLDREMKIKSEVVINGKTLPVSTQMNFAYGNGATGPTMRLKVGKYAFVASTVFQYRGPKYGYNAEFIVQKKDSVLFKMFAVSMLTYSNKVKEFSQKLGVVVSGRKYEYGWEVAYEDKRTVSKTAHAIILKLQYATKRMSTIAFTFENSKKYAEMLVNFVYVPGKQVSHVFRYTKANRQLEVFIEFLPKMFAKYMARLDKDNGYKITTDMSIEWENFIRSVRAVSEYKNNKKVLEASYSIGKDLFSFVGTYMKTNPKTLKLSASVLKHNVKLVTVLTKRNIQLRGVYNKKMLFNILADYDKRNKAVTFSVSNVKKTFFKVSGDFDKSTKTLAMLVSGESEWMKITGQYLKNELTTTLSVMKKEYFKAVGSYAKDSLTLKLIATQLKREVVFNGYLVRKTKEVTLSAKTGGKKVGLTMRADWVNYVMGVSGFFNKNKSGWQVSVKGTSLIYKVILTPAVSGQVVFEIINDRILKMSVQRKTGPNAITETSFQYKLSKNMCQFALRWNTGTIKKLTGWIKPVLKSAANNASKLLEKVYRTSADFVSDYAGDAGKTTLKFLNKIDKSFDEFDFVAARDKVGKATIKALRKVSTLIKHSLRQLARGLDNIKENFPQLIHKSKEMVAKAKEMIATMKVDYEKNLKEINEILSKVVKNLTESTQPIINRAIVLIKDFKIRGKTLTELVIITKAYTQKYVAIYNKKAQLKWNEFTAYTVENFNKAKTYVLDVKIPYRNETIKDVIEIITKKIEELKQKIADVKVKKILEDLKAKVIEFKIQNKPIKQHLVILKKSLKNLPTKTKETIIKLIEIIRAYAKTMNAAMKRASSFAKPFTNHVEFVTASVQKHFGPLYKKSLNKIINKIYKIELPSVRPYLMKQWKVIEEFFLPLLKPIKPLCKNLYRQVRNLKVMGFKVGPFSDLQMNMINEAVEKYIKKSRKMMNEKMDILTNYVETVSKMTPEEMVEKGYDISSKMSENAINYIKNMYKQREKMMKKTANKVKTLYKKMKTQYTEMTSRSFEEIMETLIHEASEKIITTADELSRILKQLASMNIAGPTSKAWKQANVLGHLRSYGVNRRIMDFIKAAKDVNLQKLVLDTVKAIKTYANGTYYQLYLRYADAYIKVAKTGEYIKSIPKKEYQEWYNELKGFTLDNKENVVQFFTKVYKRLEKRARELYYTAKKMSEVNYNAYHKDYVVPTKRWYDLVAAKSQLVYNDVKEPTITMVNHYKDITTDFAKEQYNVVYKKVMKEYKNAYDYMKNKADDLTKLIEKKYEKFLEKYGDMTWEQVGDKAFEYGQKQYLVAKEKVLQEYKKLEVKAKQLQVKAKELYKNAITKYKKQIKYLKTEINSKVMKMYKKYTKMVKEETTKYINKGKELYTETKKNALELYNRNKEKTLKAIYVEIKTYIVKQFKKNYALVVAFANKKKTELKTLLTKYYKKADVFTRNVVLPELKKESESLINQTLRGSVELAEEIVKAYYPHMLLAKDFAMKYSATLKTEAIAAFEKSKVTIKTNMDKIVKKLEDLLEKIKSHKLYKQAINHKYVIKATIKIKELIKLTKEKVEELKTHPTTVEYRKKAEIKIDELKKQISEYKDKLEAYYKHPKVVEALKTLKQIKKSGLFTYNKLREKFSLYYEIGMGALRISKILARDAVTEFTADFRKNPEETFWKLVAFTKVQSEKMYKKLMKIKKESLKRNSKMFYNKAISECKELIDECTDDWTKEKAKTLYKDAIALTRKVKRKIKELPEKMKKTLEKAYKEYKTKTTSWCKEKYNTVRAQWKICPVRAFVINPVWKEIADEVINHELAEAAQIIAGMSKEKFIELKTVAIKEFKVRKAEFEKKFNELKTKATEKYNELKTKGTKQYKELIKKYNEILRKAENFVDTTTIADIVEFTEKKYNKAVEKVKETKQKLMALKMKYTEKAEKLYSEYKAKAIAKYEEFYVKAKDLYIKYKAKVMPVYKKYEAKVVKVWNKYYPVAVEKYKKLYEKAEKKYLEISKQLENMYVKYKKETIKFMKKVKVETYDKWTKSINAKLDAAKKTTIKETIEILKKLPKQTKTLAVKTYNKYYKLAADKIDVEFKKTMKEIKAQKGKLIAIIKPYTVPTMKAFNWVKNEVTETAIFAYRYYRVTEKYKNLKSYVIKEYKRLLPIVKTKAQQYAEEYKKLAKVYAKKGVAYVKDTAAKAGHKTLRGIHSTMKLIDNVDINKMKRQVRSYYTELKKYVTVDVTDGEILVTLYHRDVTPNFSHHINRIGNKARQTIRSLKLKGKDMLKKANVQLKKLKIKAQKLKNQLQEQILENTVEIRRDVQKSYVINKKIVQRVYTNTKALAKKTYEKGMVQYKLMKVKASRMLKKAKFLAKQYYKKFIVMSQEAYSKAGDMFANMKRMRPYETLKQIRAKIIKYYGFARMYAMKSYRKYKPIVKRQIQAQMKKLKNLKKNMLPVYQTLETAVKKWRSGTSLNKSLYALYREIAFAKNYYLDELCKADFTLCDHVKKAGIIHQEFFDKYFTRLSDVYTYGKVRFHKLIQKSKHLFRKNLIEDVMYSDVAVIFGPNHVLTFDNKFYNFIGYKRPDCTYMLAHDFNDDEFSIMRQKESIIIKTPEIEIKISANGKTRTTIGKTKSFMLPVETKSNKCIRLDTQIVCHFKDQKLKVVVDLKHFVSTISLSRWHYGKTQGLLGTNNRETYDDWKLPNGKFASNEYQLANAYELTRKPACQVKPRKAKTCRKASSPRCYDIFKSSSSQFAQYFKTVDATPFYEACKDDTSACRRKETIKKAYCDIAAAYVLYAKAKGHESIPHLSECMNVGAHAVGEIWNQKPLKRAVDIVVMVSQRANESMSKKKIANVMFQLQRTLKRANYKSQYALIGFGGDSINEIAHVYPLSTGSNVFGNNVQLTKYIKRMTFKGSKTTNDAYQAILAATRLRFRPGASKVFIMFQTEPHISHIFGPSFDHALYDLMNKANASLFIFGKFTFKHLSRDHGHVIGQSVGKLYTENRPKGTPSSTRVSLQPALHVMAHKTNGGVFSNNLKNIKATVTSLSDAVKYRLGIETGLCKSCKVKGTIFGVGRAICLNRNDISC